MKNVVIYTAAHCNFSRMAKEYINKKGVLFEERPIEEEIYLKELAERKRIGTPVIVVDGEEVIGFDEERLEEIFNE